MENYKGGLKSYWKHRSYHRLDDNSGHSHPRRNRIELGNKDKRRKFWRIKISPKLKLLTRIPFSPKRIFARIRDAYVRMMLGFARSGAIAGGFGYGSYEFVGGGFGRQSEMKEYDEKMLVQIYRSILAQSQLVGGDGGGGGGVVAVGRAGK